jgi:hypothetical protein
MGTFGSEKGNYFRTGKERRVAKSPFEGHGMKCNKELCSELKAEESHVKNCSSKKPPCIPLGCITDFCDFLREKLHRVQSAG